MEKRPVMLENHFYKFVNVFASQILLKFTMCIFRLSTLIPD